MARNPVSQRQLREHWERAQPIQAAHREYAARLGRPIGLAGPLSALVELLNSASELVANSDFEPSKWSQILQENSKKISEDPIRIESQFRQLLIRRINSGRFIPIGLKQYGASRHEFRLVWDGALRAADFDLGNGDYRGPKFDFRDVRILDRSNCDVELIENWNPIWGAKKGKPRIASVPVAIERVLSREPGLDSPEYIKRAAGKVLSEISEMQKLGETETIPSEKTIKGALRERWRNSKSNTPTH